MESNTPINDDRKFVLEAILIQITEPRSQPLGYDTSRRNLHQCHHYRHIHCNVSAFNLFCQNIKYSS